MAKIIQIQYDEVAATADQFGHQADQVRRLASYLRQGMENLQCGGWEGTGANAFFNEMDCDVLPALNRLVNALEASKSHSLALNTRFRDAEEEAARWFMGESQGAPSLGRAGLGRTPHQLDLMRWLPGLFRGTDRIRDIAQFWAIARHIRAGSFYPGEVILSGSHPLKTFIMGLDSAQLTHIRAENLVDDLFAPSHHLRGAGLVFSALGLGLDWVQDFQEYGPRGGEYVAAAMAADTAQTAVSWAVAAKGAAVGAAIGTTLGPVGTVVGGLAGGILSGWAVDYAWDTPITTMLHDTSTLAFRSLSYSLGPVPGLLLTPLADRAGDWLGDGLSYSLFGTSCTDVSIKDYAVDGIVAGGRVVAGGISDVARELGLAPQAALPPIGPSAGGAAFAGGASGLARDLGLAPQAALSGSGSAVPGALGAMSGRYRDLGLASSAGAMTSASRFDQSVYAALGITSR